MRTSSSKNLEEERFSNKVLVENLQRNPKTLKLVKKSVHEFDQEVLKKRKNKKLTKKATKLLIRQKAIEKDNKQMMTRPRKGLCADGNTKGNESLSRYVIYDLKKNNYVYHHNIGLCNNNLADMFAIVHAITIALKQKIPYVYSDNLTALNWVKNRGVNTAFDFTINPHVLKLLTRSIEVLANCKIDSYNGYFVVNGDVVVSHWKQKYWKAIPAKVN